MKGETPPREPIEIAPHGIITRHSTDVLSIEDEIIAEAAKFIRQHASEPISVEDVLSEVAMSRAESGTPVSPRDEAESAGGDTPGAFGSCRQAPSRDQPGYSQRGGAIRICQPRAVQHRFQGAVGRDAHGVPSEPSGGNDVAESFLRIPGLNRTSSRVVCGPPLENLFGDAGVEPIRCEADH